jgi:hypothetical protein
MRNNTNYMETGVLSALELTSNFAKTVLENFYEKSRIPSNRAQGSALRVCPPGGPEGHDAGGSSSNVLRCRASKWAAPPPK